MLAQGVVPFDPGLVTQSVNYHGHKLLQQIVSENAGQIRTIKLQDIDYKVYQSRQVELRNLGGSRVKEIIEFISSKSDQLLIAHPELTSVKKVEETNYEDRYRHLIPFEFFLKADKNIRVDELLTLIEKGDILYTEVVNNFENTAYILLKPIAYDKGKHRFLSDLRPSDFKIILRNEDTVVPKADEDKIGRWMVGTRLRVEVLSIHLTGTVPTIYVGTKGVTLSAESREKFKLGKVLMKDLPQILSVSFDPSLKYVSDCIEKMDTYKNPQCIRQMADDMGINLRWYPTLSSTVRTELPDNERSEALRKAQMCKWAHKSVADGVAHFKQNQHEEAFQCLNKALQIDPENVEAFVAKGALLANLGRYEKAIEDFEKSLKLNPNHSNARKYMCETLVELGKQKEAKDLLKEAEKCYSRCLELNENHEVAREALTSVSEKLGPDTSLMKLIKQENLKQNEEYLASLMKLEEEMAKKNLEEVKEEVVEEKPIPIINQSRKGSKDGKLIEDNPIPIITSKYKYEEEDFLNDDSTQMSSHSHPLSPLAQKLANEESLWSHPPPCATASFMGPLGPSHASQEGSLPMSAFTPSISEVALAYSEDSNYKARVEQFLKELDSSFSSVMRSNNSEKESQQHKSRTQEKKYPKRVDIAVPEFNDLEEKLKAYYKKMEAMNSSPPESTPKENKEKEKTKANPLASKLRLSTHPAFLENDSESDEEEEKQKKAGKKKKLPKIKSISNSESSPKTIAEKVRKAAEACEKLIKISSPSSPSSLSSRSRSRSKSKGRSRRSRSHSKGRSRRSRSKSHSRGRSRRSRSHSRGRPSSRSRLRERRGRRSRSRSYRSRSRSRSAGRYNKYRKYSRSRSRDRHSRYRRSRSRSPIRSHKPKTYKIPVDSPFSYYGNKPLYKDKSSQDSKNGTLSSIPLPKDNPKPTPVKFEIKRTDKTAYLVDEAKKKIQQHIMSNDKVRNNPTVKNYIDPSRRFGKWASEAKEATKDSPKNINIFKEDGDKDKPFLKPNAE
ncbi:Tetratricopeptide repeat protein 14-like protein [Armadillidium vulgare]|nr:Tetratricopeptide repeat protein 14-like protein [Armadillidium vulgare]